MLKQGEKLVCTLALPGSTAWHASPRNECAAPVTRRYCARLDWEEWQYKSALLLALGLKEKPNAGGVCTCHSSFQSECAAGTWGSFTWLRLQWHPVENHWGKLSSTVVFGWRCCCIEKKSGGGVLWLTENPENHCSKNLEDYLKRLSPGIMHFLNGFCLNSKIRIKNFWVDVFRCFIKISHRTLFCQTLNIFAFI